MRNKTEKRIIHFLDQNGPSLMGEIVKELRLSYSTGLDHMNQLLSKGIIRHSDPPRQFELNSDAE